MTGDPAKAVAGARRAHLGEDRRPRASVAEHLAQPPGRLDAPLRRPDARPRLRRGAPRRHVRAHRRRISRTSTSPPSRACGGAPDAPPHRLVRAASPPADDLDVRLLRRSSSARLPLDVHRRGRVPERVGRLRRRGQGVHERPALDPPPHDAGRLPRHDHHRGHRRARHLPGHRSPDDLVLLHRARSRSSTTSAGGTSGRSSRRWSSTPGSRSARGRRGALAVHRPVARRARHRVRLPRPVRRRSSCRTSLFTSAIFFALPTLLRRMLPVYVGAVVLVLGYLIAGNLTANIDNRTARGARSIRSARTPPTASPSTGRSPRRTPASSRSSGVFLWNRVLWTGGRRGVARVSPYVALLLRGRRAARSEARRPRSSPEPPPVGAPAARPTLDFSPRASFAALRELTRLQLKETVKNVFFLVIVLAGVLFVIAAGLNADELYGTKTWLVTYEVLDVLGSTFSLFILIIIAFYSGELVWRERDVGLAPIFDALPIPRWVIFTSKLLALMAVQVILLAVLMASGHRAPGREGLLPLRARRLPGDALRHPAPLVLDPLRHGDAGARRREQQVRGPLRDGPLLHPRDRAAARRASSTTSIASARSPGGRTRR